MTRHKLDLFSLFSGLVLTGIALAALFDVSPEVGPWVWPTLLIAVGTAVLVSVLRPSDTDRDGSAGGGGGPTDDPEHTEVMAASRAEVDEADHTTS